MKKSTANQLYKIIDAVRASIYWKNTKGMYLGCNKYMLEMAGLAHLSEIVGKKDEELSWKHIAHELFETDQEVIQNKLPIEIEETPTLSNRERKTFLTTKTPLFDDINNVVGIIGVSIDITDRKKAEQELEIAKEVAEFANDAKTEFLRNMRHDLRTPFSGILGLANLMKSEETDPNKKENLAYIEQSAQALLDHLNEILEFIQVESGQFPILEKQFDLYQLLSDVSNMMLPTAKNKHIDFTLTINNEVPQYVIGDRIRLQRILMNLITNAIKFTEKGYVKIHTKVADKSDKKITLKFVIEDTGIGISKDKQDIIFERFSRLTSSYSGLYAGKGLGLRMVKQFLDEIEGQSGLHSEEGKGTTFKILVPYRLPLPDYSDDAITEPLGNL